MTPKAIKYLENPNKKSWAKLTTEERRFVEREGGKGPSKPKTVPVADAKNADGK